MKKTKNAIFGSIVTLVAVLGVSAVVFRLSAYNGYRILHPDDTVNIVRAYLQIFREAAICFIAILPLVITVNNLREKGNRRLQYRLLILQLVFTAAGVYLLNMFCESTSTAGFFITLALLTVSAVICTATGVFIRK